MLLCLDVGNTHILGGVMENAKPIFRFRYATHLVGTADQFGIFLVQILQNNKMNKEKISAVAVSSVVPGYDYTIRHMVNRYFNADYFVLQTDKIKQLRIQYQNPSEVGADRMANAIGAISQFPQQNLIIIDMGTATTVCAITSTGNYLGGAILPGIRLSMESLKANTARLMEVDIEMPENYIGRTTRASIQSGLFYGQLGALKEMIAGFKREVFAGEATMVIGTGGFSQLYKDQSLFDIILPDLVLQGLQIAYESR